MMHHGALRTKQYFQFEPLYCQMRTTALSFTFICELIWKTWSKQHWKNKLKYWKRTRLRLDRLKIWPCPITRLFNVSALCCVILVWNMSKKVNKLIINRQLLLAHSIHHYGSALAEWYEVEERETWKVLQFFKSTWFRDVVLGGYRKKMSVGEGRWQKKGKRTEQRGMDLKKKLWKRQVKKGRRQRTKKDGERETLERWWCLSSFVFHMGSSLSVVLSFTLLRSLSPSLSRSHPPLFALAPFGSSPFHPRSICLLRPSSRASLLLLPLCCLLSLSYSCFLSPVFIFGGRFKNLWMYLEFKGRTF